MAEPTTWHPSPNVRAARTEDGLLLLDLRRGRYLTLNASASELWAVLERGASEAALSAALAARFELPEDRARRDARDLVATLAGRRLIVPAAAEDDPPGLAGSAGPAGLAGPADSAAPSERSMAPESLAAAPGDGWRAGPRQVAQAWLRLVAVDLALRRGGLRSLYRRLDTAIPAAGEDTRPPPEAIWAVHDAVTRAAALYFKRAWCLQRSVAESLLLRARGIGAEVVIGVRSLPFLAHAWVEVDGRALGENPEMLAILTEIDRR